MSDPKLKQMELLKNAAPSPRSEKTKRDEQKAIEKLTPEQRELLKNAAPTNPKRQSKGRTPAQVNASNFVNREKKKRIEFLRARLLNADTTEEIREIEGQLRPLIEGIKHQKMIDQMGVIKPPIPGVPLRKEDIPKHPDKDPQFDLESGGRIIYKPPGSKDAGQLDMVAFMKKQNEQV